MVATDRLALLFVVPMEGVAESEFSMCSVEVRGCMHENVGGMRNELDNCFRSFSPLWLKPVTQNREEKVILNEIVQLFWSLSISFSSGYYH